MTDTLTPPTFTLGDYMRKARESAGLSSEGMAEQLGVSRNTVTNYERDNTEPTFTRLRLWARITGVDLEWLLSAPGHRITQRYAGDDDLLNHYADAA